MTRPGQAADLGAVVLARHALVELAGGDPLGGVLDVGQRAQPEPDEPEAEQDGGDQRGAGDDGLDQQELVQRALRVAQRGAEDEDVAVGLPDGEHPERRAAGRGRRGGEEDLRRVAGGGHREAREVRGQLRGVRLSALLVLGERPEDDVAVGVANLQERARGMGLDDRRRLAAAVRPAPGRRLAAKSALPASGLAADAERQRRRRLLERLVDPAVEERPERGVRGDVGGEEGDDGDGGDGQDEPAAQGHLARPRPVRAACSRRGGWCG